MDRITDSGSVDWGSTPHGCTKAPFSRSFFYSLFFLIIYQLLYLAISYISETELFIIPHMVCTQIQVFETIIRGILDTTVATGFLHSGSYENNRHTPYWILPKPICLESRLSQIRDIICIKLLFVIVSDLICYSMTTDSYKIRIKR